MSTKTENETEQGPSALDMSSNVRRLICDLWMNGDAMAYQHEGAAQHHDERFHEAIKELAKLEDEIVELVPMWGTSPAQPEAKPEEQTVPIRSSRLDSIGTLLRESLDEMREAFDIVEDLAKAGGREPSRVAKARKAFEEAFVAALRLGSEVRSLSRRAEESEASE